MNKLWLFAVGAMLVQMSTGFAQTTLSPPRPAGQSQPKAHSAPVKSSAAPAKQAAESAPDVTTASYGDWQMTCRITNVGAGQPSRRICEVLQSVILQGQTAPFAQLGFGRMEPGSPLIFTAVVPASVSFPSDVRVAVDENDKQPLIAAWTRCLQNGCFASVAVSVDSLNRWRAREGGGRLMFKNGASQDLTMPISFKGLGRALDALAKEH